MGWLGGIFGARKRREARRLREASIREALEASGADAAWPLVIRALGEDPDADELLHLAAQVLRSGGEARTAELFARAADAPHDPRRLLELGSSLLSDEQPEVAALILERALAFVPFDAVVRSELALAHARSGRPDRVLETLALHPCLADDPGALFEFGWAALLSGDLAAAEGSLRELTGAPALRQKLGLALERARIGMGAQPPDARDYYFIESAGLLVDARGPLRGRHEELSLDAARCAAILGDLGAALREALPTPRHVIPLTEADYPLASAVARAAGGSVLPRGRGRLPAGLGVTMEASQLSEVDDASWRSGEVCWFAMTMDWSRTAPRAPDYLGAFARSVTCAADAFSSEVGASHRAEPDGALRRFVEARRSQLPPHGERVRSAYVPDAPL